MWGVEVWRGGLVPHPAQRTGRANLPHPALGEDSRNRQGYLRVTPSATSENNSGVIRRTGRTRDRHTLDLHTRAIGFYCEA